MDKVEMNKKDIEELVDSGIKNGVLEIYEDLLKTIWAKVSPTLGTVTVATIMQRAISRVAVNHKVLLYLTLTDAGPSFDKIRDKVGEEDREELKASFREFFADFFDILAKLTGNILVQQLVKEVDGLEFEPENQLNE